uniref:Uncharacterized protein n=2 Tax=mine drainage metagenome TaxID=410659 RepID=E6QWQ5_9ZZZZ
MSRDHSPDSERALVRAAASSPAARARLKENLIPYVVEATEEFMHKRGIPENQRDALIEVGMEPFDRVFNIYLKNMHHYNEDEGEFYQYYIWWSRQAIVAFLYPEK